MPRPRRYMLGLAAAVISAWPAGGTLAQAPERPPLLPMRDATVTYRLEGVGENDAHKLVVTYTKAGERTRADFFRWVEAKGPYLSIIYDRPSDRYVVVLTERRSYYQGGIGSNQNPGALLKPGMSFARKGQASVVGVPCTQWSVTTADKTNNAGNVCVTEDGIVLRVGSSGPNDASVTATDLDYAPPSADLFRPPADFSRLATK